jgi:hypothetical protein
MWICMLTFLNKFLESICMNLYEVGVSLRDQTAAPKLSLETCRSTLKTNLFVQCKYIFVKKKVMLLLLPDPPQYRTHT